MTGIFVPRMEIPETCFLCPFVFREFCSPSYHLYADELRSRLVDGKLKECPLIFVCYSGLYEV